MRILICAASIVAPLTAMAAGPELDCVRHSVLGANVSESTDPDQSKATPRCDRGYKLAGGGINLLKVQEDGSLPTSAELHRIRVVASYPDPDEEQWVCQSALVRAIARSLVYDCYAICCKVGTSSKTKGKSRPLRAQQRSPVQLPQKK
jgi:hypothetical protein